MKKPDELVKKLFHFLGCPKGMKLKTKTIKCTRTSFEITDEQWESLFGKGEDYGEDKKECKS